MVTPVRGPWDGIKPLPVTTTAQTLHFRPGCPGPGRRSTGGQQLSRGMGSTLQLQVTALTPAATDRSLSCLDKGVPHRQSLSPDWQAQQHDWDSIREAWLVAYLASSSAPQREGIQKGDQG